MRFLRRLPAAVATVAATAASVVAATVFATAVFAIVGLSGCASPPRGAGGVGMDDLALPEEVRDLALTVYPTPRRAEYGDDLLPLDGALVVDESSPDVDAHLRAAGLEIGFRELPAEGYALSVSSDGGRTVVLAAARDAAGRAWARAALDRVTVERDGRRLVRTCRVLDAPIFPLRGSKRPQPWELAYGANFAWETKDLPEYAGRDGVATYAPGNVLDATPAGVQRILDEWRPAQDRGVRRFCVKFDDVGFEMTDETEARHGTYPSAVRYLVASLRTALRERDPGALLYLLPQTYWWNDRRFGAYARALRSAGGVEPDVGLVLTGPEIISDTIDAAGLAAARGQFGSVETAALIYDNLGREGDWGPLAGRDPLLATLCDGVFGERGTPVNRLTRLDWLWNPQAYDAERSWGRAILELAGPDGFAELRDACDAFRRRAPRSEAAALVERFARGPGGRRAGPVPGETIAALLRSDLARLPADAGPPVGAAR